MQLNQLSYTDYLRLNGFNNKSKHENKKKYEYNLKKTLSNLNYQSILNGALVFTHEVYNFFIFKNYKQEIFDSHSFEKFFDILDDSFLDSSTDKYHDAFIKTSEIISYIFYDELSNDDNFITFKNGKFEKKLKDLNFNMDLLENKISKVIESEKYLRALILKDSSGTVDKVLTDINHFIDFSKNYSIGNKSELDISDIFFKIDKKFKNNVEDIRNIREVGEVVKVLPSEYIYFDYEEVFLYYLAQNKFKTYNHKSQISKNKNINISFYTNNTFLKNNIVYDESSKNTYFMNSFLKNLYSYLIYLLYKYLNSNKMLKNNNFNYNVIYSFSKKLSLDFKDNFEEFFIDFDIFKDFLLDEDPDFFSLDSLSSFEPQHYQKNIIKKLSTGKLDYSLNIIFSSAYDLENQELELKSIKKRNENFHFLIFTVDEEHELENFNNDKKIFRLNNSKLFFNMTELIDEIIKWVIKNILNKG